MEYRIKKCNIIPPGTFYALTQNETIEYGKINYPLWIVNTDSGRLTEIEKGEATFDKNDTEYIIYAGGFVFYVNTRQDMFHNNFRNATNYYWQKGKNILFLSQYDAAKKAQEILMRKQRKINEELNMVNSLILF
jgi:hypothetical protein